MRDLNRLELAGESVRACLEALAAAAPDWLGAAIDVPGWSRRYGARIDSWRLPAAKTKRDALAVTYGRDGFALLTAVYAPTAPGWLADLPAVGMLRTALIQNYTRTIDSHGREVVKRREADTDGLPPGRHRITSPYDRDARRGMKRDLAWNGYKLHISETRDTASTASTTSTAGGPADDIPAGPPNLITNVATTDASVPDSAMTEPIHAMLARRGLLPGEHYLDSGYPSADLLVTSLTRYGIALITPLRPDTSPQAATPDGFDRTAFTIDWDAQHVTCPQGHTTRSWNPTSQRGTDVIVVRFAGEACQPCPVKARCTTATRTGRQLTLRPKAVQQALDQARTEQTTTAWQTKYALRAGAEATIAQTIAVTDARHARYRGLAKTHLEHVYQAVAINLIRLHAWWNGHPLDRTHTGHLARLELALAA